jgi:hypothetical protein
MNIDALKKIVVEAYSVSGAATTIPRFSTQFTFTDTQVLVRIPIYECQPPSHPLVALIAQIVSTALPHLKKTPESLEQDILAAAEGKELPGRELDIRGIVVSTSVSGGRPVHAVTECRILLQRR